ncbi:hypothetical protein DFJ73DRAFT_825787, partial [Zopfochytrium polystomum]
MLAATTTSSSSSSSSSPSPSPSPAFFVATAVAPPASAREPLLAPGRPRRQSDSFLPSPSSTAAAAHHHLPFYHDNHDHDRNQLHKGGSLYPNLSSHASFFPFQPLQLPSVAAVTHPFDHVAGRGTEGLEVALVFRRVATTVPRLVAANAPVVALVVALCFPAHVRPIGTEYSRRIFKRPPGIRRPGESQVSQVDLVHPRTVFGLL